MVEKAGSVFRKNMSRIRRTGSLLFELLSSKIQYEYRGEDKIYIEVSEIRRKFLFQILNALSFTKYEVNLGVGISDIEKYVGVEEGFSVSRAENYKAWLSRPLSREKYVFLSDRRRELEQSSGWKKKVFLDYDCFGREEALPTVPLGMHPEQVLAGRDRELGRYRFQDSKVTLLFAGACQPEEYATETVTDFFGKVPRNELYDMLCQILERPDYTTTRNPERLLNTDKKIDVALFVRPDGRDNRVPREDWLRVLAAADFFVAGPGVYLPMSHNAIEALAVGTIPIIEYPELFTPDLSDAGACVPFDGRGEFREIIRSCLAREGPSPEILKKKATDYYDTYLAPEAVGRTLEREVLDGLSGSTGEIETVNVVTDYESVDALKSRVTEEFEA